MNFIRFPVLLIVIGSFSSYSSAQYLTCKIELTTYVWGDHIDYLEWSCSPEETEMHSSYFEENIAHGNVTSMHIIGTTNTSIPMELNQNFPQLKSLRVEFTDLTSIGENETEGLRKVKNLYLGNNNITDVTQNAFDSLPQLELLYLNGNNITRLEKSTFDKLTNLERLWLNDNQLTELHSELLSQNTKLNRVYLQNNKISIIGKETFSIPNLHIVDLRGNICINKWTFDTPFHAVKERTEKDCNPSVESMRKSSIVMAKIIHELSLRDIALHNKIAMMQEKIDSLESDMSNDEE